MRQTQPARLFGVIKEFESTKTFGFIEGQDGQHHFVHFVELPSAWRPRQYRDQLRGRSVTFEIQTDSIGRSKAVRVFVIDEADEHRIGQDIAVEDVHA